MSSRKREETIKEGEVATLCHVRSRISSHSRLQRRIAVLPTTPGVYRWKDNHGNVLYVGKAKNLRKRLQSYLRRKNNDGPWRKALCESMKDVDITVTGSELEALILEMNLIKELQPKYNVLMKDDKNYLFIKVSVEDLYPRVETVRRLEKDGGKYFGPYLSSNEVRKTLDMLQETLQYRACKQSLDRLNKKYKTDLTNSIPCLECQIGRCNGLCIGTINSEVYLQRMDALMSFLRGNREPVREIIKERMHRAALERKFELAAKLRNELLMFAKEPEQQLMTDTTGETSDILGVAVLSHRVHVTILHRRDGRMIGESHFALSGQAESTASVLEQFLPQFYDEGREVPPIVMLPTEVDNDDVLRDLLSQRRGSTVKLLTPQRGRKEHLLQLAERNAIEKAQQMEGKWEAEEKNMKNALEELKTTLRLPTLPKRIEGFDISHLGGTETVGSMVVMLNGKACNDQYRSFTIRTMKKGEVDDYRALREMLTRRLRHLTGSMEEELHIWGKKGIHIRKARKTDHANIEALVRANPENLSSDDLGEGRFVVAEKKGEIIGCCRIFAHPTGLQELRSVCVDTKERGKKLGQSMVRFLLSRQKTEKTYIVIDPTLEQYYAENGFRHVLKAPPILERKAKNIVTENPKLAPPLVMVYDAQQHKPDRSLESTPGLIVIDGGKGQLSTALKVQKEYACTIPIVALAKREEELFIPGSPHPIPLLKDSPALFLLMRLRDEAHRFANRHREKRIKNHLLQD